MSKHKVLHLLPVGSTPLCVSNCFPVKHFLPIVNLGHVQPIIAPFSNRIRVFQSQVAALWLDEEDENFPLQSVREIKKSMAF